MRTHCCSVVRHFFIKLFGTKYNLPRWVLKIFQFDFVIAAVSFLLLSIVYLIYPHSWMLRIDVFFSKRLEYTSAALSEYGFPIIGGTHKNLASSGLVIDSSYMRIVYDYGFLFLVALLTMFTLLQKGNHAKRQLASLCAVLCCSTFCF